MAHRTKTREPLPTVTEDTLLNEAMQCPTDRPPQPRQKVVLPNMSAGCSMADMADPEDVYACWDELAEAGITDVVPVTYIHSAASLKAFCGRNGGIVCTSSNAAKV